MYNFTWENSAAPMHIEELHIILLVQLIDTHAHYICMLHDATFILSDKTFNHCLLYLSRSARARQFLMRLTRHVVRFIMRQLIPETKKNRIRFPLRTKDQTRFFFSSKMYVPICGIHSSIICVAQEVLTSFHVKTCAAWCFC